MIPRVMIVEDEEPLSLMLRYNLEAEGYQVDSVERGATMRAAARVIRKAGVEFRIFSAAQTQALWYGLASVALALIIGWLGRVMFRKD